MSTQHELPTPEVVASDSKSTVVGTRLRERRKEMGLSQHELAKRTKLTASFLSLVERGQNNPSLDSLRRIGEALDVPLFYFTQQLNGQHPVVRRDERVKITFPPGNVTCELIVPNLRNRLEIFIARAHPSAGNIAQRPKHDSEECVFVMEGGLRVVLDSGEYLLQKGDSIYFRGGMLREISATGRREAEFLSVITPPVV